MSVAENLGRYLSYAERTYQRKDFELVNGKNDVVDVDVDGVYERRPKPLCPHLEITSR